VPGGDQTAFVPSGIEYELWRPDDSRGLKLLAATVTDYGADGLLWLVAVKNEGPQIVCVPSVVALFLDENDFEVGSTQADVNADIHITDTQAIARCLGIGDIGMGVGSFRRPPVEVPIKHVTYGLQGFLEDTTTKISSAALQKIAIADAAVASTTLSGTLTNNGSTAIQFPQIVVYPLNSVGRPFSVGRAMFMQDLAPGTSWDFNMSLDGPVGRYAAFTDYR
jgi:hypothetical protein